MESVTVMENNEEIKSEEIDEETKLKQLQPTQEQLEIALGNCRKIYDPRNQIPKEDFYEFIDSDLPKYGKITLFAFIVNTIQDFLKEIDEKEGEKMIKIVTNYVRNADRINEQQVLCSRIFDVLCSPIHFVENSAFIQVWNDLLESSLNYSECLLNNFEPYEFPNNLIY